MKVCSLLNSIEYKDGWFHIGLLPFMVGMRALLTHEGDRRCSLHQRDGCESFGNDAGTLMDDFPS